ncbi:hypothetical protein GGI15_000520 [Coemansia interrupta]|uniref:Fungal lipase-type domain-containing protein n=1 Tax=Coemansia interrupta TaxID=1126814 RepID=A0A9W8LMB3_9FUNG|nr:hypothetical protein GGI15_000520 [Coemansia interrupta]
MALLLASKAIVADVPEKQINGLYEKVTSYRRIYESTKLPLPSTNNSQTTQVTSDTIVKYCRYSGAAYKLLGSTWRCSENCESEDTRGTVVDYQWAVPNAPSHGFVAHKDDTREIIVSWRGSTVLMDWIADFSFAPVIWPAELDGSMVHTGFLGAYKGAAEKIKHVLKELVEQHPDYKIVLTGHSLGGAEAALAAADIVLTHPEWINKLELYTYGEPRTGNSVFANWLSSQPFPMYRVVYRGDLVSQVPFRQMGYQHHAQEAWYCGNSTTSASNVNGQEPLRFCGQNSENISCQASIQTLKLSVVNHLQYPGLSYDVLYFFLGNIHMLA